MPTNFPGSVTSQSKPPVLLSTANAVVARANTTPRSKNASVSAGIAITTGRARLSVQSFAWHLTTGQVAPNLSPGVTVQVRQPSVSTGANVVVGRASVSSGAGMKFAVSGGVDFITPRTRIAVQSRVVAASGTATVTPARARVSAQGTQAHLATNNFLVFGRASASPRSRPSAALTGTFVTVKPAWIATWAAKVSYGTTGSATAHAGVLSTQPGLPPTVFSTVDVLIAHAGVTSRSAQPSLLTTAAYIPKPGYVSAGSTRVSHAAGANVTVVVHAVATASQARPATIGGFGAVFKLSNAQVSLEGTLWVVREVSPPYTVHPTIVYTRGRTSTVKVRRRL